MKSTKLSLNLHRAGDCFRETILILSAYSKSKNWELTEKYVLQNNLLQKKAEGTTKDILRTVRKRFFEISSFLPDPNRLGTFLTLPIAERAKNQVMFVYVYYSDPLVAEVFNVKLSNPMKEDHLIRNSMLVEFLYKIADRKNLSWSKSTVSKWVVKFKTMLRRVGYLKGNLLIKPFIRLEAFAFFFLWAYWQTESARKALEHPAISIWHMDKEDFSKLLMEGVDKEWWHYTKGAGVVEFKPKLKNFDEWLDVLGSKTI